MARLRRNDNAGPAAGHHLPELLEHDGRTVEIDAEDRVRRCLTGGHTGGVDEPDDLGDARRLADQCDDGLARGYVDGRDAHLVAGIGHDLGCRVRVRLAAVGEHDVLADADAACDGLTDLAGSDDNDDVLHAVPRFGT